MSFETKKLKTNKIVQEEVDLTPFIATIDREFDLEKIAKEQNYQETSDEEMEAIISKIDIPQSLDELLEILD